MNQPQSRTHPQPQAGFSLLELVLVVTIFGILLKVGFPAFQSVKLGSALGSAQNDVAATILRARWLAINAGTSHTVDLSASAVISVTRGGTAVASTGLTQYSVTQTHTGGNTFDFDPRGLIPSGTTTPITITLTNPLNSTRTVTVDRLGRLTIS